MKNFHGLDRARGYGLKSMSRQEKLTALAVNLKRIANILSSKKALQAEDSFILLKIINAISHFQRFIRKFEKTA